jgi:hypothetical protein
LSLLSLVGEREFVLCDLGTARLRLIGNGLCRKKMARSGSARARQVFWSETEPGPDSGPLYMSGSITEEVNSCSAS